MSNFVGTTGNDTLNGGANDDNFFIDAGGNDVVHGGGGSDTIYAADAFTAKDKLDGGDSLDILQLDGDYAAGVMVNAGNLHSIEQITLEDGGAYKLTFADGNYGLSRVDQTLSILASYYGADATMDIDGSAVTTMSFYMQSAVGNDHLQGGALADNFYLIGGGNDTVDGGGGDDSIRAHGGWPGDMSLSGGAGDDIIDMEYTFDLRDTIDGGSGTDWLSLELGGGPTMTLSDRSISQVEEIFITGSGPVDIRLADNLADARLTTPYLTVDASQKDDSLRIDGAAERDTSLHLSGGSGDDWLRGGAKGDVLDITAEFFGYGEDTVMGGKGDDTILVEDGGMNAGVSIDGGGGHDVLQILQRNFVELVDISGVSNVEQIVLDGTTNLVLGDGNVAKGRVLEIAATDDVGDSNPISIDGSAETNGRLSISSGQGFDTLIGGGGDDTLVGAAGGDTLTGGAGADRFTFLSLSDSAPDGVDLITDLTGKDIIDLRQIDANVHLDGDQAFKLVDHFTGKEGQAVLSYDKDAGVTSLSLDVDGDGSADGIILLEGDQHRFSHFVL